MSQPRFVRPLALAAGVWLVAAGAFVTANARAAAATTARDVATAARLAAHRRALVDTVAVYTEAQATRGQEVFTAICSECHEVEDLTNEDFRLNWDNTTLYELFDNIRTTMPDENPGTLTQQQYIDVTTYVLKLNKLPAGEVEFTGDSASASAVRLPLPPPGEVEVTGDTASTVDTTWTGAVGLRRRQ